MHDSGNKFLEHCEEAPNSYADFFLKHQQKLVAEKKYLREKFIKHYAQSDERPGFVERYISQIEITSCVEKQTEQLVKVRNRTREKIQQQLDQYADKWERETRNLSSPKAIVRHPSVQAIVDLGPDVVPMILRRMESRPWFWFDILMTVTKEPVDPITPDMRGDMQRMTEAWIQWGVDRGII